MVNVMGTSIFLATALAVAAGGAVSGEQAPRPGTLETYKDWTIGCDNRNRCEAVALLPEGANWPDVPMTVGVVRDAGSDANAEIWFSRDSKGITQLRFLVDGRQVATATARDGEARVTGPQASALAIAMARGSVMEVRSATKLLGRPSLAGSGAALRYMDALQGRAGTTTALVATGALGPNAVKLAPAAPVVKRMPVSTGGPPAALWREELSSLGRMTGCSEELNGSQQPELHRLGKGETLILVPCGSGAYNFSTVPVIATGIAGRRAFRLAGFDSTPGWIENPALPMLVNAGWTPEKSRLESYAKGRGLGDCGGSQAYVWDGTRFRLIEARAMGECRGAWQWIRVWTAQVSE